MLTVTESRWKKMLVFGRLDGSECVRFFDGGKFSCRSPTRRSLGETPSMRFRLIIIDSSDDLPALIAEFAVVSKLTSEHARSIWKELSASYFDRGDKRIDRHSYRELWLALSSHRYYMN